MEADAIRRVRSGKEYDYLFPPATGNDITVKKSADVADTVSFIQNNIPKTTWQTKKLAQFVKGRNLNETCSKLWHFLYEHIPYKKDEEGIEQIRSPRRVWHDRNRYNSNGEVGVDCDCFTSIVSSTLLAMSPPVPHKYRITKYPKRNGETPRWQHIYVVVPKDGKLDYELSNRDDYIVIDCVKNAYNDEQPYLEFKDFDAKMRLDYLDGLEEEEYEVPNSIDAKDFASVYDEEDLGKVGQWLKKTVKKVGDTAGKVIRTLNKVANPATILLRNGFLIAMKINLLNVAKKLRYGYVSDEQARQMGMDLSVLAKVRKVREKAETIFYQAGGKKENLKKAILNGHGNRDKKVPLSGLFGLGDVYADQDEYDIINGTGHLGQLGDPATGSAIAAAMTTMTALAAALKQVKNLFPKGGKEADSFNSETDTDPGAAAIDTSNISVSEDGDIQSMTLAPATMKTLAPATTTAVTTSASDQGSQIPATTDDSAPPEGFFAKAGAWIKKNPIPTALVVAGIGTGIYFLTKKKEGLSGLDGISGRRQTKRKPRKRTGKKTAKKKTYKAVRIR